MCVGVGEVCAGVVWVAVDARLLDAEPDCSVSGLSGAGLSSQRHPSRDAASVGGGQKHQPQVQSHGSVLITITITITTISSSFNTITSQHQVHHYKPDMPVNTNRNVSVLVARGT